MTFYRLADDPRYSPIEYSAGTEWETVVCSRVSGHQRIGRRLGPLQFDITDAINREFFWTHSSELVVTENLVGLLSDCGFAGFEVTRCALSSIKSDIQFFEFKALGLGGLARNMELRYTCEYCDLHRYAERNQPQTQSYLSLTRVVVDESLWDGSDVFTVSGLPRILLITDRFKDLIVAKELKGCEIALAHDFNSKIY